MAQTDANVVPFCGSAYVPPDKSISHRALIVASMAQGVSKLSNLLDSQDVNSTLRCLRALGAQIEVLNRGDGMFNARVEGWGKMGPKPSGEPLDCGNSGTTTRLLLGMLSGYDVTATLIGDDSLQSRPMKRVVDPLTRMGAHFFKPSQTPGQPDAPWDGSEITLPIKVQGTSKLRGLKYASPKASAQVKTSLILAGINCAGEASLTEPYQSRNHTELMLPGFNIELDLQPMCVHIRGGQVPSACDIYVPGDPSSAMFLAVAAALVPGSDIQITNLGFNPTRIAGLEVAKRMGCNIQMHQTDKLGEEPMGTIRVRYAEGLRGVTVTPSEVPNLIDEIPILALLATAANSATTFCEVSELRVKESNRLAAIIDDLTALGCNAIEEGDNLVIEPGIPCNSATIDSRGDHRLAMTLLLANKCFGLDGTVEDLDCVSVSFPGFIEELEKLQKQES